MFSVLLNVLAPVLICTSIGFYWVRSGAAYNAEFVTRMVMYIGAPCLIVSSITQVDVSVDAMLEVAGAATLMLLGMTILGLLAIRVSGGDWRTLLPPVIFANNANMGLPLCLFAFGEQGLAFSVAYFVMFAVFHMSIGVVILSRAGGGIVAKLVDTSKQPLMISAALACSILYWGIQLPTWLLNTLDLISGLTVPLMLITLGVSLATLRSSDWLQSVSYSAVRIGGGLIAGIAIAELLELEGVARQVVILQSMMPAAVFNYLLALKYERQPELVAGIVITSTLMAFCVLPLVLMVLI